MSITDQNQLVASAAAAQLGIKAVTLRKYSTMIEQQLNDEQRFRTSSNHHRLYSTADLVAFKQAIALSEAGTPLAAALSQTFSSTPAPMTTTIEPAATSEKPVSTTTPAAKSPLYAELSQQNHELMKQNETLQKQQQIMTRRLDSLNYRLNLVLDKLDQPTKPTKPWWLAWLK